MLGEKDGGVMSGRDAGIRASVGGGTQGAKFVKVSLSLAVHYP